MSLPNGADCTGICCLKIRDLGVRKGSSQILHNIHLHLQCGEFVALIGPNGAGKSTLLKAILGEVSHSGSIEFTALGRAEEKLRVGYVPQAPGFDRGDPTSVLDLFTCCVSRRPVFLPTGRKLRSKVIECLSWVQGETLIDQRVGTLSGGELQRVLLALALEPMPHLLILDEPLSGVDLEGMNLVMHMLDEVRRRHKLSILMTTHDFTLLEQYADRVVLLDKTVLRSGSAGEVLRSEYFREVFHLKGDAGR